jgi:hypothetical protein
MENLPAGTICNKAKVLLVASNPDDQKRLVRLAVATIMEKVIVPRTSPIPGWFS